MFNLPLARKIARCADLALVDFQIKEAAATGDDGWLPAPYHAPLPIGPDLQQAYAQYARHVAAAQAEAARLKNLPFAGVGNGRVKPRGA